MTLKQLLREEMNDWLRSRGAAGGTEHGFLAHVASLANSDSRREAFAVYDGQEVARAARVVWREPSPRS